MCTWLKTSYQILRLNQSSTSQTPVHSKSLGDPIKNVESESVDLEWSQDSAFRTSSPMMEVLLIQRLEHSVGSASINVDGGSPRGLRWFQRSAP